MVSVSSNLSSESATRLCQSVDFALQNLLGSRDSDPLALAFYLWVLNKHRQPLINSGSLPVWGLNWIRRIFIEQQISRRRDEEIASASLAVITLAGDADFKKIELEVRAGFENLLHIELERNLIPLKRPAYGVLFLLAAHVLGIDLINFNEKGSLAGHAFVDAIPGGRLFGLVFASQLLETIDEQTGIEKLESQAVKSLFEMKGDYEDQCYTLQSLWHLRRNTKGAADQSVIEFSRALLNKSPVWQYLMNGTEEIQPAGDGEAVVYVSHLYRAALLDVLLEYQNEEAFYREEQLDKKYQGRAGVSWSAFGFYMVVFAVVWMVTAYFMMPSANAARRYWIVGDFKAMKTPFAILYLVGIIWIAYLGILTYFIVPSAYSVFVKSKIQSDQRIKDVLGEQFLKATKVWLAAIVFALIFGVFTNLIAPTAQHIFKREAWINTK